MLDWFFGSMLGGIVVGFIGWYMNQDAKPMKIGLTFLYAGLATFVGSMLFQGHGFFTWAGALIFASMTLLFRDDLPLGKRVGSIAVTTNRQDLRLGSNINNPIRTPRLWLIAVPFWGLPLLFVIVVCAEKFDLLPLTLEQPILAAALAIFLSGGVPILQSEALPMPIKVVLASAYYLVSGAAIAFFGFIFGWWFLMLMGAQP